MSEVKRRQLAVRRPQEWWDRMDAATDASGTTVNTIANDLLDAWLKARESQDGFESQVESVRIARRHATDAVAQVASEMASPD